MTVARLARQTLLLIALFLGTATADSSDLTVQAPPQVVADQAFEVQVSAADSAGWTGGGSTVILSLVADNPPPTLVLGGTLQASMADGKAVFPAVVVHGVPDAGGSIRLAVVAVCGTRTVSGVSAALELKPAPVSGYRDTTPGGIGVDIVLENGKVIVTKPIDGMPAALAGVRPGDCIVRIDGKSTVGSTAESLGTGLGGPVGTAVVLSVLHKGSTQVQDISMVRVAIVHNSIRFNTVQNQMNEGAFQISILVQDGTGQPLPDAKVTVRLDPAYAKIHVLFLTTTEVLKDASGTPVSELTGVTGADGIATLWVRLGSNATPFKSALTATVEWHQKTLNTVQSNVFTVYNPSE